ncbi:MAG: GntR family transcriptional regulator [Clostridia bacterium]|nr:GntR family transcriptional regulator [Clostridia bacterium]
MIEHKTVSLADQVFEHLENAILSGKYSRGEILTESKLSAELGVSRTPIREALRRLEQEHIIEESGKGSVVIGITEKDLEDIFLIREKLECLAASLAANNRTEEQLAEFKEILELQEFYLEKQDAERIKHMDNRFHRTLYRLSGSMSFYDTLVPLHKKIQKYRRASVESKSRAVDSVREHRVIYEAIAAKDETAAAEAAKQHVENAYRHIIGKD